MASIERTVADSADDCHQIGASVITGANDCVSGNVGVDATGGLRFQNVTIPRRATIISATLGFYVSSNTGLIQLDIYGEAADNPTAWGAGHGPADISKTTAKRDWNCTPPSTGARGEDVTPIVQELVNRAGWVSGDAMCIAIFHDPAAGAGLNIEWEAVDKSGGTPATLKVVYANPFSYEWPQGYNCQRKKYEWP